MGLESEPALNNDLKDFRYLVSFTTKVCTIILYWHDSIYVDSKPKCVL